MKKPKSLSTYIPGFGIVKKEDFNDEHFRACVSIAQEGGVDIDAFIASNFDTVDDDAELTRLIEEEEKAKPKKAKKEK